MFCKRIALLTLYLFITISSYGCLGLLTYVLFEEPENEITKVEVVEQETVSPEDSNRQEPENENNDHRSSEDDTDETDNVTFPNLYDLDMSSASAFISDVYSKYGIMISDRHRYLSGPDGENMMRELGGALYAFTPTFIRVLVAEYKEYGGAFTIRLETYSSTEYGTTLWDRDLTITLHYDSDPVECGITTAVLAHELAHAVHFIIEEYIGEAQSLKELRAFNGSFEYVGEYYDDVWDPAIHSSYFAYDYGMSDHYEDFATIIEMLAGFPEEMLDRLSDGQNDPLIQKTMYLREIMYHYIAETDVFASLYEAERYLNIQAA